jgi:hypothetical protein
VKWALLLAGLGMIAGCERDPYQQFIGTKVLVDYDTAGETLSYGRVNGCLSQSGREELTLTNALVFGQGKVNGSVVIPRAKIRMVRTYGPCE